MPSMSTRWGLATTVPVGADEQVEDAAAIALALRRAARDLRCEDRRQPVAAAGQVAVDLRRAGCATSGDVDARAERRAGSAPSTSIVQATSRQRMRVEHRELRP